MSKQTCASCSRLRAELDARTAFSGIVTGVFLEKELKEIKDVREENSRLKAELEATKTQYKWAKEYISNSDKEGKRLAEELDKERARQDEFRKKVEQKIGTRPHWIMSLFDDVFGRAGVDNATCACGHKHVEHHLTHDKQECEQCDCPEYRVSIEEKKDG